VSDHLRTALEEATGARIIGLGRVGGGCISDAYEVHLDDDRRLFCKHHPSPPPGFFSVEARALAWIAEPGVIGVPAVVAFRDADPAFLALEWIEVGHPTDDTPTRFGRELARLHRAGAPAYGWSDDGFIGSLPQTNTPELTWPDFYRHQRLEPLVARADTMGRLPDGARRRFERLYPRLPELCGPSEPPARLHGDLWGGNVLLDRTGRSWLINPAPYGGHREVDLAMMHLFGGFGRATYAAYDDEFPLAPGVEDRIALYQLYPLLVHVILFGGGYIHQLDTALRRYT